MQSLSHFDMLIVMYTYSVYGERERERETESDKRTLREREKRLLDI